MTGLPDPLVYKDLAEAKAALARHGIVIIRSLETDLVPAVMSEVKDMLSSSPALLGDLDEEELDKLMESLRKTAYRSSKDLVTMYTQLLAQLGTEHLGDLVKELDGIESLFTWERVSRAVEPVNRKLAKAGFEEIHLPSADAVSESFAVELTEKWPVAFTRFRGLSKEALKQLGPPPKKAAPPRRPAKKKGRSTKKKR